MNDFKVTLHLFSIHPPIRPNASDPLSDFPMRGVLAASTVTIAPGWSAGLSPHSTACALTAGVRAPCQGPCSGDLVTY